MGLQQQQHASRAAQPHNDGTPPPSQQSHCQNKGPLMRPLMVLALQIWLLDTMY